MGVAPELLEILACPACRTPVTLLPDGRGLRCGACRRVYPIQDDIPVMLVDEATVEDAGGGEPAGGGAGDDAAGP